MQARWTRPCEGWDYNLDVNLATELPPALLYDRQILKSGFRAIHRLLEFTADPQWLAAL